MDKPTDVTGYPPQAVELVRATCLYVATKLGDLLDEIVIIGGLVPSLCVDQRGDNAGFEAHIGTLDLDLGLALLLLDHERYRELAERLKRAGFTPDLNIKGNPTKQRWRLSSAQITVDFLISPSRPDERGGRLKHLDSDLAAIIIPGLHLAFQDRLKVTLSGETPFGELASREVWVCGPGAFVILKALALRARGENKDAYDLYYIVKHFREGPSSVSQHLKALIHDPLTQQALKILQEDFQTLDHLGAVRVAHFLFQARDDNLQAEVAGYIKELLREVNN